MARPCQRGAESEANNGQRWIGTTKQEAMMAHKKKHGGPVPPGNQSQEGPTDATGTPAKRGASEVASAQEQDPKRRLGDFEGKGEHSIQEPGGKNDANH